MSYIFWTKAVEDRLRELLQRPMSSAAAALKLNAEFGTSYSKNALVGKISRLGLRTNIPQGWPTNKPRPRHKIKTAHKPKPSKRTRFYEARYEMFLNAPKEPMPRLAPIADHPHRCDLMGLKHSSCRFPLNDGPAFLFCGETRMDHVSYCRQQHYRTTHA